MKLASNEIWLTIGEYAHLAAISPQAARKRVRASRSAGCDHPVVKEVFGRGGRNGSSHRIALSSLSEELQKRYAALFGTEASPRAPIAIPLRKPAPNQSAEIARRKPVLDAVLAHPVGSMERRAEIEAQAARGGRGFSVQTIYRWIRDHEAHGRSANSLARKLPSDAGQPRVQVSRAFDKAFMSHGYTVDQLALIAPEAERLIKAAWASVAGRGGATRVKVEVATAVARYCREAGCPMPDDPDLVSDRRVRELRTFRVAGRFREDARWAHNNLPREKRDWSLLAPMQVVCADVKVWDNLLVRLDGSIKTPAYIAFLDCATMRMFGRFYLLGKGEGIRQEHVTDAYLDMVQDEDWGFPERLYLDNGSEFAKFEAIRSAMARINNLDGREIIYAKPYHGSSKPIESRFAWLQRYVSSQLGGYVGGELGRPLTHQHGKKAHPYAGTIDSFAQDAAERIAVLEHTHVFRSGNFAGRTSASVFADWCAANWRPTLVPAAALDATFHERVEKRVYDRGIVKLGGEWTHPDIHSLIGQHVQLALPWRRGAPPMFLHPEFGWTSLQERLPYHPLDKAGADASRKTQKAATTAIRRMEGEAGEIDLYQNHRDRVAALPAPSRQRELRLFRRIQATPEAEQIARAQAEPGTRAVEQKTAHEHNSNRRKLLTAALEKKHAAGN